MEERVRFARQTRDEAERADPSMRGHPQSVDADPIAAALGVVVGMTDGPAGASRDSAEIEDSGRARRVEDRLAAMRSELGGRG
jgi:hypothetical protein